MTVSWTFLTDFGDSAVTLPLALFVALILVWRGRRSTAAAWLLAVGACGVSIAVLKLLLGSCASTPLLPGLISPSGHAAMSMAVYGSFAVLASAPLGRTGAVLVRALALALVAAIAWSRLVLGAHTGTEVVAGLAIGALAVLAFATLSRPSPQPALPPARLAAGAVILVLAVHGTHWPIEQTIKQLSAALRHAVTVCR